MANAHDIDPERLSSRFIGHMQAPANLGELDAPGGRAEMTGQCGDCIGIHIAVAEDRLAQVRVQPKGCVYTLVCASALSTLARGRTLDEALCIEPEDVAAELGSLPEDHLHCARLAVNALGEAIADFYRHRGNGQK